MNSGQWQPDAADVAWMIADFMFRRWQKIRRTLDEFEKQELEWLINEWRRLSLEEEMELIGGHGNE